MDHSLDQIRSKIWYEDDHIWLLVYLLNCNSVRVRTTAKGKMVFYLLRDPGRPPGRVLPVVHKRFRYKLTSSTWCFKGWTFGYVVTTKSRCNCATNDTSYNPNEQRQQPQQHDNSNSSNSNNSVSDVVLTPSLHDRIKVRINYIGKIKIIN
jgi:hypothetical protein